MNIKNVGGTPGGLGEFVLGVVMAAAGFYLLTQRVQVTTGFGWYLWGYNAFGLSLLPFLIGIGLLAYSRSVWGWVLTAAGLAIVLAGVLMNLHIYFVSTSLWDTLTMLVLLAFGLGLVARALRPAR